jgi:hypothetical protein
LGKSSGRIEPRNLALLLSYRRSSIVETLITFLSTGQCTSPPAGVSPGGAYPSRIIALVSPKLVALVLGPAALSATTLVGGCTSQTSGAGAHAHALGEQAVVGYNQRTSTGARSVDTKLAITVLSVRRGTQNDLTKAGFQVDAKDRGATPYYVAVRYENRGTGTVTRNLDVGLEDAHGNLLGSTLVFNYGDKPFPLCKQVNKGALRPGQAYEGCTLSLVPKGVEVGKVSFLGDNGPSKEPQFVYWKSR